MALDPVCGMTVDPARAAGHVDHEGTTYSFCSKGCVAKFKADPKHYLSGTREPMSPPAPALLKIGGLKPAKNAERRTSNAERRMENGRRQIAFVISSAILPGCVNAGIEDSHQFIFFLKQRSNSAGSDKFHSLDELKPPAGFAQLFQTNPQLMNEVIP